MNKMYKDGTSKEPLTQEQQYEKRIKSLENKVAMMTEQMQILRQDLHNTKRTNRRHASDISNVNTYVRTIKK